MSQHLNFSEEEVKKVQILDKITKEGEGWESWAMSKLLTRERVHKESMYRVLQSLWYIKYWVNFMEVAEGTFLFKFGSMEDRDRILGLDPWLFDKHILSLMPYKSGLDIQSYNFRGGALLDLCL